MPSFRSYEGLLLWITHAGIRQDLACQHETVRTHFTSVIWCVQWENEAGAWFYPFGNWLDCKKWMLNTRREPVDDQKEIIWKLCVMIWLCKLNSTTESVWNNFDWFCELNQLIHWRDLTLHVLCSILFPSHFFNTPGIVYDEYSQLCEEFLMFLYCKSHWIKQMSAKCINIKILMNWPSISVKSLIHLSSVSCLLLCHIGVWHLKRVFALSVCNFGIFGWTLTYRK